MMLYFLKWRRLLKENIRSNKRKKNTTQYFINSIIKCLRNIYNIYFYLKKTFHAVRYTLCLDNIWYIIFFKYSCTKKNIFSPCRINVSLEMIKSNTRWQKNFKKYVIYKQQSRIGNWNTTDYLESVKLLYLRADTITRKNVSYTLKGKKNCKVINISRENWDS